MRLFKKKCEYCRSKIDKEKEVVGDVKVPSLVGTRQKAFCCNEHFKNYEKEVVEMNKKKSSGSCCA
jgi:hypothetical protein